MDRDDGVIAFNLKFLYFKKAAVANFANIITIATIKTTYKY